MRTIRWAWTVATSADCDPGAAVCEQANQTSRAFPAKLDEHIMLLVKPVIASATRSLKVACLSSRADVRRRLLFQTSAVGSSKRT